MKSCASITLAGFFAATFAVTGAAMPTGTELEKAPGAYPMDCTIAKDKARCTALNQKVKECKEKTDDEWLDCMYPLVPRTEFIAPKPRDCSKASNKYLCEAHVRALDACKGERTRSEHRKCVGGQLRRTIFTTK